MAKAGILDKAGFGHAKPGLGKNRCQTWFGNQKLTKLEFQKHFDNRVLVKAGLRLPKLEFYHLKRHVVLYDVGFTTK